MCFQQAMYGVGAQRFMMSAGQHQHIMLGARSTFTGCSPTTNRLLCCVPTYCMHVTNLYLGMCTGAWVLLLTCHRAHFPTCICVVSLSACRRAGGEWLAAFGMGRLAGVAELSSCYVCKVRKHTFPHAYVLSFPSFPHTFPHAYVSL